MEYIQNILSHEKQEEAKQAILSRLNEIMEEETRLKDEKLKLTSSLILIEEIEKITNNNNSRFKQKAISIRGKHNGVRNRDCIIKTLETSENPWLTAAEIQEHASAIKGSKIPMSSISPGLTELKNESLIVRRGFLVALVTRSNK